MLARSSASLQAQTPATTGAGRTAVATRAFPVFACAWLAATSILFMLLVGEGGDSGVLPRELQRAVGFTPTLGYHEPWRILAAPVAVLFSGDVVQYAYVGAIFMLAVPAFEAREGWKRTTYVFFAGGMGGVFLGTFLVLAPLALLMPENAVVAHAVARPYMGASTAVFAVAGALAATVATPRARWAILGGAIAWETYVWFGFFNFQELISVFHYAALAAGYVLAKTPLYARLAPST